MTQPDQTPPPVADPAAGRGAVLTLEVADVDAIVDRLTGRGTTILSGPIDQPWAAAPRPSVTPMVCSGNLPDGCGRRA